jgi:hypothetical protein
MVSSSPLTSPHKFKANGGREADALSILQLYIKRYDAERDMKPELVSVLLAFAGILSSLRILSRTVAHTEALTVLTIQ